MSPSCQELAHLNARVRAHSRLRVSDRLDLASLDPAQLGRAPEAGQVADVRRLVILRVGPGCRSVHSPMTSTVVSIVITASASVSTTLSTRPLRGTGLALSTHRLTVVRLA